MSTTAASMTTPGPTTPAPWPRRAVWLIVASGALTAWATIEHQPDPTTRFGDWSAFVTTDRFLATHLLGSILGQGLYLVGAAALALGAYQVTPRRRWAAAGFSLTALGTSGLLAGFGIAAFAQPVVARLTLDGQAEQARGLYDQLYGRGTIAVLVMSGLLYAAGSLVLGRAVAALPGVPRWAAVSFGASGPLIAFLGVLVGFLQTVGSIALVGAAIRILQATDRPSDSHPPAADHLPTTESPQATSAPTAPGRFADPAPASAPELAGRQPSRSE